jgi:hypothetical protein
MNVTLFSGNVWKVCAQPTVMGWRNTVCPLEPAPEVALVGKAQSRGDINRLLTARQALACFCQPQLDKPGVRSKVEFAFKTARQGKPVRPGFTRKIGQPDVIANMGIQVIACAMGHRRAL